MLNDRWPAMGRGAAVVTYSRLPPTRRSSRPAGRTGEVPVVIAGETSFDDGPAVPDIGAAPSIDLAEAAVAADLLTRRGRWRPLNAVVVAGALAIVAGIGILAITYYKAVDVPAAAPTAQLGEAVPTASGPAAADTVAATAARMAVPGEAAVVAPAAGPVGPATAVDVPASQPTATAATGSEGSMPTATPPMPHPRPQEQPAAVARTQPTAPSDPSGMDGLMNRIDQILASLPPDPEPATTQPPPPASAELASPPAAPPYLFGPTTSGDTQPVATHASPAPVPPAPIPNVTASLPALH